MAEHEKTLFEQFYDTVVDNIRTLPEELINIWWCFDMNDKHIYMQIRGEHKRTGLSYFAGCAISANEIHEARLDTLQNAFDRLRAKLYFAINYESVPIPYA